MLANNKGQIRVNGYICPNVIGSVKKIPMKKNRTTKVSSCKYIHRVCNQTPLNGFKYCIRHILEDKTAPFRQCSFVSSLNKKRCTNAAPKSEKRESICPFHNKRAFMNSRATQKKKLVKGPSALLLALEHHCQSFNHNKSYEQTTTREAIPYSIDESASTSLKNFGSLESMPTTVRNTKVFENPDEDATLDEDEDCLKHAGVFTAEEVLQLTHNKMLRLESLYLNQLKKLNSDLKEKRREFLLKQATEKFLSGNISTNLKKIKGRQHSVLIKQVKALESYHRRQGIDLLLHHRFLEKRYKKKPHGKEEDLLISKEELKMPSLKYITQDPKQNLFINCTADGGKCKVPVLPVRGLDLCAAHLKYVPFKPKESEFKVGNAKEPLLPPETVLELTQEEEPFQSMDDIASLGLDNIIPGTFFGLDQFGDPGESKDSVLF